MKPVADEPVALPEIPRKRYFAIGEVSELCAVKPHVLRYWEQEFPQLKPVKRRGNRRYYQHDDVQMVRRIRSLLYEQGFTIGGARQRLRELRNEVVNAAEDVASKALSPSERKRKALRDIRVELEGLLDRWPL
jgi:DNA-binding transcriptional MerR regulator